MIKEWRNTALLLPCDLDVHYVHLRPQGAVRLETLVSSALSHYVSCGTPCLFCSFYSVCTAGIDGHKVNREKINNLKELSGKTAPFSLTKNQRYGIL